MVQHVKKFSKCNFCLNFNAKSKQGTCSKFHFSIKSLTYRIFLKTRLCDPHLLGSSFSIPLKKGKQQYQKASSSKCEAKKGRVIRGWFLTAFYSQRRGLGCEVSVGKNCCAYENKNGSENNGYGFHRFVICSHLLLGLSQRLQAGFGKKKKRGGPKNLGLCLQSALRRRTNTNAPNRAAATSRLKQLAISTLKLGEV